MLLSAVAIECILPDKTIISCSGLKLSENIVITHGTLISKVIKDYLSNDSELLTRQLDTPSVLKFVKNASLKFKVFEGSNTSGNLTKKLHPFNFEFEKKISLADPNGSLDHQSSAEEASLLFYWFYSELADDLMKLLPATHGWKLSEDENLAFETETFILCSFLILSTYSNKTNWASLAEIFELCASPVKGFPIVIESSPFGTVCLPMFFNSISKGIISNVSPSGQLFITDGRSIYGCEGAPAYVIDDDRISLCGFVLAPFCWLNGEWLGLTLMCSAKHLLKSLSSSLKGSKLEYLLSSPFTPFIKSSTSNILPSLDIPDTTSMDKYLKAVDHINKCLVSIECIETGGKSTRGTGFIVDGELGIIVTCAHVIEKTRNMMVMIKDFNGKIHVGEVIFKTDASENSFSLANIDVIDIAIIISSEGYSHSLLLADEVTNPGTPILTGGFGLFDPGLWGPTFSSGIISKIMKYPTRDLYFRSPSLATIKHLAKSFDTIKDIPLFIQTTCDVYGGTSGGPVVSFGRKGIEVIGIIVCSASESTNKIKFPQINLAVCSWLLSRLIQNYVLSRDKDEFEMLRLKNRKPLITWNYGLSKSRL